MPGSDQQAAAFCKSCSRYNDFATTLEYGVSAELKATNAGLRDAARFRVMNALEGMRDALENTGDPKGYNKLLDACRDCDYKVPLIARHFENKNDKKEEKKNK